MKYGRPKLYVVLGFAFSVACVLGAVASEVDRQRRLDALAVQIAAVDAERKLLDERLAVVSPRPGKVQTAEESARWVAVLGEYISVTTRLSILSGDRFASHPTAGYWLFAAQAPLLVSAPFVLWRHIGKSRRRRRRAAGLCGACGYNLRGSPERCPECGEAAAELAEETAVIGAGGRRGR